jgi:multiple antibiotic resistance protein
MFVDLFLKAFISFLIIANPLGAAAMFMGLMSYADAKEIKHTALKAVFVAGGVLLVFAFFGEMVLVKFGITIPAFRVAGGILLFSIAYRMLFGEVKPEIVREDQRSFSDRRDIAVFPLGIPMIRGPAVFP